MSLNRVVIMGRFTRDPEVRRTPSDVAVTSFSLAVDRDFKDKNTGERTADFIDVVAWRNTAEFVSKYFRKGKMAVVEGKLQTREWVDKEDRKRRNVEIIADNIYFADSKKDDGQPGNATYAGSEPIPNDFYEVPGGLDDVDFF